MFNVGGGRANSVSLAELTDLCRARADASIPIGSEPRTSDADVPYYVTDNAAVTAATRLDARASLSRPFSTKCSPGCGSIERRSGAGAEQPGLAATPVASTPAEPR